MKISQIYAGKPDAGDEIREIGFDEFAESYIEPSGINIERLASTEYGTPFYIMGDKGTGKTALLYFLSYYVSSIDESSCTSFLFFEREYTHVNREKLNTISKSISTSVSIEGSFASTGINMECDFTYIWKWQFYQKFIADNETFNNGIFIEDENWNLFCKEINKIDKTINGEKMKIPSRVNFYTEMNPSSGSISPGISFEPLDLSLKDFTTTLGYSKFVNIIENADKYFKDVRRTDIPYYIFIDELEAYRGEGDTFYRDLRMIRDLLFIVKRFNDVFRGGTKILSSVRLEILGAINKFIESKQLHKIMQGYDERLLWEYTNTNSYAHPIMKMIIKRISNAERKSGNELITKDDIIKKWFVTPVFNTHICTYILNNSWHKPRDIVRLLLSAQSKNSKNFSVFDQNTFTTFMPIYSKNCLVEIKEELRALYTAEDIDSIFGAIEGFKSIFTFEDIEIRAKRLFPESVFAKETYSVLKDMYRIGVIGNINKNGQRWAYKEQENLFIDSPWKIMVHPALRIELSVNGRNDYIINKEQIINNEIFEVKVERISFKYLIVSFVKGSKKHKGYISFLQLCRKIDYGKLRDHYDVGDILKARVSGYNKQYDNWYMSEVEDI